MNGWTKHDVPGCIAIILLLVVSGFFIFAEFARALVWIKWAFS